ncbi:MAG: TolC family protein [Alphaproteobacteria bacterium]|jgi:multidrug efflux system outer membrane protein
MLFSEQKRFVFNRLVLFLSFGAVLGLSAGCAVRTEPTTAAERSARVEVDKAELFNGQEELKGPVTLYQAIARAVKYNSDQRVALMEQAVSYGVADSATMDMLPSIAASGGFVSRSDRLAVSAESVRTGRRTLENSFIEDKNVENADLQVVYNVLDFGISYVNAKQASDKKFITEEIRRKSMQRLVHDVRTAFWKAAAAQRIQKDLDAMIKAVQEEVVRTKTDDLTQSSLPQLSEQKKMLTALQSLMELRKDTLTAKAELAALMNLPPNVEFELDIPAEMDTHRVIRDFGTADLEHFALINRPELRIGDYEARIMGLEAKKEFLRYFPGLEFAAGVNYNSNSFLYNQHWADAGVRVTWNLMNLFTRPQAIRLADDKAALERARRVAMTMAVMSQVNIAYLQLRQASESFEVTSTLDNVDEHMWKKTFARKTDSDKARRDAMVSAVNRLVSHLKRDFSYAEYKDAESSLFLVLGVDPLPRFSLSASVDSIAETLQDNLSRNAPQGFKEVSYDRLPSDQGQASVLTPEQREKITEWAAGEKKPAALNEPTLLVGSASAPVRKPSLKPEASKVPLKKTTARPAAKALGTVPSGAKKMLQVASFEQLENAQKHWQELLLEDETLNVYMPVYKETEVPGYGTRFRTFITDTEDRLKELCRRLAPHLKSCLIRDK